MYYLVYKITNTINGKEYIGAHKTKNKDDGYMGSGKYLKYSIKKYGIENFKKTILHECVDEQHMYEMEKDLVKLCENSYNLKTGGLGGWNYINENKLNNTSKQHIKAGKIGGKSCYEKRIGIHSPDFERPPQKKLVEDSDMILAYNKYKSVGKTLKSLGLSRTGGSRRRLEKLIASLI